MEKTSAPVPAVGGRARLSSGHHVCPWWVGYLLASPLRRIFENPEKLLAPHVRPGMIVLDLGCAMGFFSLPLARLVGPYGRVVCVDLQERMLRTLQGRARRGGLERIIETRACTADRLGIEDLAGKADLAVAYHVVHETPDPERFLSDCLGALQPGGKLLLAEPKGHVKEEDRAVIFALAQQVGFEKLYDLPVRKSQAALFGKPA